MSSDWYQVVALGARYWFALLGVIIVWRALRWQFGDSKRRKQVLRNLPDAGYIGTLYVLEGESEDFDEGDSINIPAEGVLGSAMACDVFIPHPSISARHMLFHLFPDGLHIRAYRDQQLIVDGEVLEPGEQAILRHGAVIVLGSVELQLRLFVGVVLKDALSGDPPPPPREKMRKGKQKKPRKKKKSGKQAEKQKPERKLFKIKKGPPEEEFPYEEEPEEYYGAEEEAPWNTNTWGNPFDEDDNNYH